MDLWRRRYPHIFIFILISMTNIEAEVDSRYFDAGVGCNLANTSDFSKTSNCAAVVECFGSTVGITNILRGWSYCGERQLKSVYNPRFGHYTHEPVFTHQFLLQLKMVNVNTIGNPFSEIENFKDSIYSVIITRSEDIPTNMYNLHLKDVQIVGNTIERINLNKFITIDELRSINASHNLISELDTVLDTIETTARSKVTTIDLSYNSIEALPNNCFVHFSQLEHLSLSHNVINSLDILTFEGMSQLRTLQLSHNKLFEIEQTLARFINLEELKLDNNYITTIIEPNFRSMIKLKTINLSSNKIKHLEDESFQNLVKLSEVDLSYNEVTVVHKTYFMNNNDLYSLSLSNNNINSIESGAFEGKNISTFNIENNKLSGLLEEGTFEGLYLNNFDLSCGLITELGPDVFRNSQISSLNLSYNLLSNISKSAFHSLNKLVELDVSNNNLSSIDFDTDDLKELSLFHAQNNTVKKLSRNTFQKLLQLTELDLSYNIISEVESQSFKDLKGLETLKLSHNNFISTVESNIFTGLTALITLELDHTRTLSVRDEALSGMVSLKYFNASHGELVNISYNAFKNTGSLEVIDVSHNLLENFLVNTTTVYLVKELYLNKNKLTNVSNEMLSNLIHLQKLDLSNNNIIKIASKAFLPLVELSKLELSSNADLEISGDIFENLTSLSEVSLNNIKIQLNFEHVNNTSIQQLDVSSCNIENLNTIFIFKVKNLIHLDLSRNKISFINKNSFQTMPSLSWLDLSFNSISHVQPGSFLHMNSIRTLNLHDNEISSLQFGVFDGLRDLQTLNLSSNALHSFGVNLMHNIPHISVISLDDNVIEDIKFEDFSNKNLKEMYIGGNLISCHLFTDLKSREFQYLVTAEKLDYHSENVDGVTCRSVSKKNDVSWPQLNNTDGNTTQAFIELASAIESLRRCIENLNNKNESNVTYDFKKDIINVLGSIDEHINNNTKVLLELTNGQNIISNKSETVNNDSINLKELTNIMKQLTNVSKETHTHLVYIDEYIKNQTKIGIESKKFLNNDKSVLTDQNLQEYIKILNEEKEQMITELKIFQDIKNQSEIKKTYDAYTSEQNGSSLIYINVICLVIITVIFVGKLVHNFVKSRKRNLHGHSNDFHSSTQPIVNSIEMQ